MKPNLGLYNDPPEWQDIVNYFRGSELQNYFTKILEDAFKAIIKPQYVDQIPKAIKGNQRSVQNILDKRNEMKNQDAVCEILDLKNVLDRNVDDLSGGELQRFACAVGKSYILWSLIVAYAWRRAKTQNFPGKFQK